MKREPFYFQYRPGKYGEEAECREITREKFEDLWLRWHQRAAQRRKRETQESGK